MENYFFKNDSLKNFLTELFKNTPLEGMEDDLYSGKLPEISSSEVEDDRKVIDKVNLLERILWAAALNIEGRRPQNDWEFSTIVKITGILRSLFWLCLAWRLKKSWQQNYENFFIRKNDQIVVWKKEPNND